MTTVSYLITAAKGDNLEPYLNFVVESQEDVGVDTDKAFFGIMSENVSLSAAITELMAMSFDGRQVFVPHIQNIDTDYIIECSLVGNVDVVGRLPHPGDRQFSIHHGETSADLGDALTVTSQGLDHAAVEQHIAYLRFCDAERNERRSAP